jgi:hypothetical protein
MSTGATTVPRNAHTDPSPGKTTQKPHKNHCKNVDASQFLCFPATSFFLSPN